MNDIDHIINELPDPNAARRFFEDLTSRARSTAEKIRKETPLLSDLLTIATYSPLLSTTVLQNPHYIAWLRRHRTETSVRTKDELMESLSRFEMTNTSLTPQVLLARFRRRELLRIFLKDIRRLVTVSEITEELSNLADASLEYALRLAMSEFTKRYGMPLTVDEKNRAVAAEFCVISLGKLGSKELNYSSDIDLLFIYSAEGSTSGQGSRGAVTCREFFVKVGEYLNKLVGDQTGEGAAYRVDMRLRPHGRVGALALSLQDTAKYYIEEAQAWERQVLIRSRASAGDLSLFKKFSAAVQPSVFSKEITVAQALSNVRRSKEKIDREHATASGFNVKLGKGGIREIEFIAQALELAHGGHDLWLREPHTLIALSRLKEHGYISENELTILSDAYAFLRRTEHILQMEHGLQTHLVADVLEKKELLAKRLHLNSAEQLDEELLQKCSGVRAIFERIFGSYADKNVEEGSEKPQLEIPVAPNIETEKDIIENAAFYQFKTSLTKFPANNISASQMSAVERICEVSPVFSELLHANPLLAETLTTDSTASAADYKAEIAASIENARTLSVELANLRRTFARLILSIAADDIFERISIAESKARQTALAEGAIQAALTIARREMSRSTGRKFRSLPLAVLGLGKFGGRGMDFGSDLDLILVYDDESDFQAPTGQTLQQFFAKTTEHFVNALSSMTRDGSLYRVDLRLRPDGKNGTICIAASAFREYIISRAAIWELLAYVRIRAAENTEGFPQSIGLTAQSLVHSRASEITAEDLRKETVRVRALLQYERAIKRDREIDIKYGEGGLLDVYFGIRFLQLKHNVPEAPEIRSTAAMIEKLFNENAIESQRREEFTAAYKFLSEFSHFLRLYSNSSSRINYSQSALLGRIADRMKFGSVQLLLEQLTLARLAVRSTYEHIVN